VVPTVTIAFPLFVANVPAAFGDQFKQLFVDAFPGKYIFIPECHAEVCFRASCVGQSLIAGFW